MDRLDCCNPKEKRSSNKETAAPPPSEPAVHGGPSEDDVDTLVEQILKDPSINISVIPDSVERLIYKSTIQLTVNAFYSILSGLEGTKFMAHQIHLRISRASDDNDNDNPERNRSCLLMEPSPTSDIDDLVLEEVATRLLSNKAINQRFLPDRIEHMLYTNCLKVVFRMLDILTGSLHITLCGHDIGLFLEPAAWQEIARNTAATTSSALLSDIDQEKLHEFARLEAGIEEELGFWDSLFVPKHFVAQLHASLYGLVLAIADDMLANTKLEILSDTITFDIVPVPEMEHSHRGIRKSDESHTTAESTRSGAFDSQPQQPLARQLESVGFEAERAIFLQRFQDMTPEQRAILTKDIHGLLGSD